MPLLDLSAQDLLTTTRAVRKRLDFDRAVPEELLRECVDVALQAPQGSNKLKTEFLIVRDPRLIEEVGRIYLEVYEADYETRADGMFQRVDPLEASQEQNQRTAPSVRYLAENMSRVPAMVIPCTTPRLDADPWPRAKSRLATIFPTTWNFMLAARLRGLGTCWTGMGLQREHDIAEILGIPYESVEQTALIPVAYTIGDEFKPAWRPPAEDFIRWDRW